MHGELDTFTEICTNTKLPIGSQFPTLLGQIFDLVRTKAPKFSKAASSKVLSSLNVDRIFYRTRIQFEKDENPSYRVHIQFQALVAHYFVA